MNAILKQSAGEIQAVVERNDSPHRQGLADRCFKTLVLSPSKKYAAEMTYFERSVFARRYSGPLLLLKVVSFEKGQYRYYWPNTTSINAHYLDDADCHYNMLDLRTLTWKFFLTEDPHDFIVINKRSLILFQQEEHPAVLAKMTPLKFNVFNNVLVEDDPFVMLADRTNC